MKLYSRGVVILDFLQGLWFGNRVEKSLINPNQCRKFGIQIYDDPNDPNRKLEIEASEELVVPMPMEKSTRGIVTHPPTDEELHECQNILSSDEFDWDP